MEDKCIEKCSACGKERSIEHKWNGCKCERCGAVSHTKLSDAVKAVFNNPFSDTTDDPEDKLWKEPLQKELDILVKGGTDSIAAIEKLLTECAEGQGDYSISDIFQSGGKEAMKAAYAKWKAGYKWIVKTAAMLPKKEAVEMMLRLMQKEHSLASGHYWYYFHKEAARELGMAGDTNALPVLQKYLEQPSSDLPLAEILQAIEKLNGIIPDTPYVIFARADIAKQQSGGNDICYIEYLLPYLEQTNTWNKGAISGYYLRLFGASERLGYKTASFAFLAALLKEDPESYTCKLAFNKAGIAISPKNVELLHAHLSVPKTIDEIKSYAINLTDIPGLDSVLADIKPGRWSFQTSGGSNYYSQNAGSLLLASEILKQLTSIPPQTYYLVDTPDGTLGRDINGFFTEALIKTANLKIDYPCGKTESVQAQSLMGFGNTEENMSSVAVIKNSGGYAKLILMMKCGQCGYDSPIETVSGDMERQCYFCGANNRTQRGNIVRIVNTPHGIVREEI